LEHFEGIWLTDFGLVDWWRDGGGEIFDGGRSKIVIF